MIMRFLNGSKGRLLSNLVKNTYPENLVRPNKVCLRTCNRSIDLLPWKVQGLHTQTPYQKSAVQADSRNTGQNLYSILEDAVSTVQAEQVPSEATVLQSLEACETLAKTLVESAAAPKSGVKSDATPNADLLFLEEQHDPSGRTPSSSPTLATSQKSKAIERISSASENIIANPTVFITPKILETYINIQSLLQKPKTLGNVLHLYSNKPLPTPGTNPIRYRTPNPNKISSAVPLSTAHSALTVAINAKDLSVCLDIIKSTVCTTAFKRKKIAQRALIPTLSLALAPLAAYTLASQLSSYQNSMSPEMATQIAFVGILAYVGFTATIGVVAVATANDQMDRVTWATGMPLRERWLREEERAMLDRVAVAWGFKESSKRGEEEGQYWEDLREWVGLRGMVLDRVGLMEGME